MEETGGYPQELFTTPPNEIFNCSICLNIAKDPMRCPDEHIFCRSCINSWLLKGKTSCPNDRKFLDNRSLSVFRTADAILGEYCMKCTAALPRDKPLTVVNRAWKDGRVVKKKVNYKPGICNWTGKLKELCRHKETCTEMLVKCPHSDCKLSFLGRDLAAHKAKCRHRLEPCKHCGKLRKPSKRSVHRQRCPKIEVRCCSPHCKVVLPRKELGAHHETCPLAIICCPFAIQLNCKYKCPRAEMRKHTEDRFTHLEVTLQKVDAMERTTASYEDKLYSQEMIIQTLRTDLDAVKEELAAKTRRMEWLEGMGLGRLREGVPW